SDPQAAGQVQAQADLLAAERGTPVTVGYAAVGQPTVAAAVADLRAQTASPVAVASYLLAPGHFQDHLAGTGADWITAPLRAHPTAGRAPRDGGAGDRQVPDPPHASCQGRLVVAECRQPFSPSGLEADGSKSANDRRHVSCAVQHADYDLLVGPVLDQRTERS